MGGGGGQYHNVLAVLGHVQKLSAILVTVVYLTMTMRWRTTSHDIEANHTICVLWSCYNVVLLNLRAYHIARPSYDLRTTSYRSHDHCTTLIYKAMLPSHQAIIVKPYVIVRLWFSFPPSNHSQVVCHRTTIVRLYYDVIRFHRHYRCVANPSFRMTTKLRLWYRSRRRSSVWPML